jgi:copper chaperone CopZ
MKILLSMIAAFGIGFAVEGLAADDTPTLPAPVVLKVTGLFDGKRESELRQVLEDVPGVELVSIDYEHGEGSFRFDPAKAFPGVKPQDIVTRFNEKLRSVSAATFGVKPLSSTPHEKLQRVEIPIIGLDCRACSLAAYEAVAKLDGVEQATASFHDGLVTALIDPQKTDRSKLEAALKEKRVQLRQP